MQEATIRKQQHRIRDIHTVEPMAWRLAHYFPHPDQVTTGIYELLMNAIEHGNLEIGFTQKTHLIHEGRWQEEIYMRQRMPQYVAREAMITLEDADDYIRLHIADQGRGFDWRYYLDHKSPDTLPNGRGLQIAMATGFDEIRFNDQGNEVTCIVRK